MSADLRVRITDVAPRDGLQNEAGVIPTSGKAELVRLLCRSGVDEVEVSSFVSPRWVPQLADAAEVFAAVAADKPAGVMFSALVPNEKGMQTALAVHRSGGGELLDKVTVFTAASETFSRKNTNASIAETLERFKPVIAAARENGLLVRAYVSTCFRCPYEGDVSPAAVADVCERLLALGVDEVDPSDTIGAATAESTRTVLTAISETVGQAAMQRMTLHLHDTTGRAAECVRQALEMGLRSFDGSAGGLGGCPYASTPTARAPGNISTEVLVQTVTLAGFTTNVELAALRRAADFARGLVARRAP
jgi:hydroxymethylglutaryl-CoA lyase